MKCSFVHRRKKHEPHEKKRVQRTWAGKWLDTYDLLAVACCLLFLGIERWREQPEMCVWFFSSSWKYWLNIKCHGIARFIAGKEITAIRLRTIYHMTWCVKFTWARPHIHERKSHSWALRAWFCQVIYVVSFYTHSHTHTKRRRKKFPMLPCETLDFPLLSVKHDTWFWSHWVDCKNIYYVCLCVSVSVCISFEEIIYYLSRIARTQ